MNVRRAQAAAQLIVDLTLISVGILLTTSVVWVARIAFEFASQNGINTLQASTIFGLFVGLGLAYHNRKGRAS